jgi:P27 family predicted phage terminase small subunit
MGATARRRIGAVTTPGGGSEHVPTEPETVPLPDPPGWLGDDARKVWDRLAPLVPDGNLTEATAEAFALCCVAVATYSEAHGIVIEAGLLIAEGQALLPNPALAIRTTHNALTASWLKTFGLTPDTPPSTKPGRGGYRPHLVES